MRAEELKELLNRQPSQSIRLHLTDGQTYDIKHPDNIMVSRSRVDIGVGANENGIVDRVDFISLLHIVRVEDLATPVGPSN